MSNELEMALRSTVRALHDSHLGLAEVAHHLKDRKAKKFLLLESLARQQFAGELEAELQRHGVREVTEGGTAAGAVHRTWNELKAHLGGGDHAMLASAAEGEEETITVYGQALSERNLPLPLKQLLTRQRDHILEAVDEIKGLRGNHAA